MNQSDRWRTASALMMARLTLGLLFLMGGWYKVFDMGLKEHARDFFVSPYADSWIPTALLWFLGVAIPLAELIAGAMMIAGLRVREAAWSLGAVLVMVTYGHLLSDPMFSFHTHIFPRLAMVLAILLLPSAWDTWSIDAYMAARKSMPEERSQGSPEDES